MKGVGDVVCPDGGTCADGQTCCSSGTGGYDCCPDPNGVCCSGDKCCQSGNVCCSDEGCCSVDYPVCCGNMNGCCTLDHPVCCSDHKHCCPAGYDCDPNVRKQEGWKLFCISSQQSLHIHTLLHYNLPDVYVGIVGWIYRTISILLVSLLF